MPGALAPGGQDSAPHHTAPSPRRSGSIRWESIVDQVPFGLVVLSPQQEVIHENAVCSKILGCGIQEKGGVEEWLSSLCPDREHKEKVIASWRDHVWRNQLTRTFSLKGSDEKLKEIEFRSSLQPDGGITLVLQDVTQERRAEETLRHGKLKFRALFSHLESGTILIDRRGRIVDANPAFQQLVGVSLNRLRLTSLTDLLGTNDFSAVAESEESLFAKPIVRPDDIESRDVTIKTVAGEKSGRLTLCPVGDAEGQPLMGLYLLERIGRSDSEEKWATKFRAIAKRAQALLDVVPDLILLVDRDLTVADFSPPPKSWEKLRPDASWKGQALERTWPVLGGLLENTRDQILNDGKTVHAELKSCGSSFQVTLGACGEEQLIAVVREKEVAIPAPPPEVAPVEVEKQPAPGIDRTQAQHHFRNQLQLVTSLFSLEPQDSAARDAFLRWQIRLRCVAQACPESDESEMAIVPLLRAIADEVCSLLGRGAGQREIVVSGMENLGIGMQQATAMSLLAGEVMRLVVCGQKPATGPQLFLNVSAEPSGGFRMNARTGPLAKFAFSGKEGETEILEVLSRQIQGRLEVPSGVDPRDEWDLVVPPLSA